MPTFPTNSLSGIPGAKDIAFSADEISHMRRFGTGDRFYPACSAKQLRKGRLPQYGIRTEPPWKFVGFEKANGKLFYRFSQDDMSDDPKWNTARKAEAMLGEPLNQFVAPEVIRQRDGYRCDVTQMTDREYQQHMETAIWSASKSEAAMELDNEQLRQHNAYVSDLVTEYRALGQRRAIGDMTLDEFQLWLTPALVSATTKHFAVGDLNMLSAMTAAGEYLVEMYNAERQRRHGQSLPDAC